ncbi:MAG: MarR family transcriptional regulator [Lachnospiraceae bacterium]|nr:MarR family transcriptional regulator [Lachnospiraceae bacterium]
MFDLVNVKILNTAIERVLNVEMSELGLTFTQTSIINFLSKNEEKEICQRDIEVSLGLTHPTVSSILKRLESKKMILTMHSDKDRRFKRIVLTEKSRAVNEAIQRKARKITAQALKGITKEEEQQLCEIMERMTGNLRQ